MTFWQGRLDDHVAKNANACFVRHFHETRQMLSVRIDGKRSLRITVSQCTLGQARMDVAFEHRDIVSQHLLVLQTQPGVGEQPAGHDQAEYGRSNDSPEPRCIKDVEEINSTQGWRRQQAVTKSQSLTWTSQPHCNGHR